MQDIEHLLQAQANIGDVIQRINTNYKKDGADRKTSVDYFQHRLKSLNVAWFELEENDRKIRQVMDGHIDKPNFTSDFFNGVKKSVVQLEAEFQQKISELRDRALQQQTADLSTNSIISKKLRFPIMALRKTLLELENDDRDHPVQLFKTKLDFIKRLWKTIEELNFEICSQPKDPAGHNSDEYFQLKDSVQKQIVNLSIKIDEAVQTSMQSSMAYRTIQETSTQSAVPLPRVTIPQFSGDYLEWRQFFELFSQMVDKQQLPAVQKMWYLKNNECFLALNNIGVDTDTWDPLLLQLHIKKLDKNMHIRFEQSIASPKELIKLDGFLQFLENHDKEKSQPNPKKKRGLTNGSCLTTIMTILLILPLIIGAPVENKRFESKLGIHFDKLGSLAVSSTEWNILVYYDLSSYWTETEEFILGLHSLNQLCQKIKLNSTCAGIIHHFQKMENELRMDNKLMKVSRHKRGAIDLVGNIAHSLFGVLDSKYAKTMAKTIEKVKGNEVHLMGLLKNQTSIVDSTINVFKQAQITASGKFGELDREISTLMQKIKNVSMEYYQFQVTQLFHFGSIQLLLVEDHLRRMQSSIIDAFTDSHHGKISPRLLTPAQLQQEIDRISIHLPMRLDLPIPKDDLLQFYKLMKVKWGFTERHIIFTVTLPLIEHDQFEIFSLTPIPIWSNNTLMVIEPCTPILALNIIRQQQLGINRKQLDSCNNINQNRFICSNVAVRYEVGSENCACKIGLFNNKTTPNCHINKLMTKTTWTPIHNKNQWIYATAHSSPATAVCEKGIIPVTIKGSGLLTLEPDCVLQHQLITMKPQRSMSSISNMSYTRFGSIPELVNQQQLKSVLNPGNNTNLRQLKNNQSRQLEELSSLQKKLQALNFSDLPNQIQSHRYHSNVLGYAALALSIGIIAIACLKNITRRKNQQNQAILSPHKEGTNNTTNTNPSEHPQQTSLAVRFQQFQINSSPEEI